METVLAAIGFLLFALAATLKAIAPIATTAIAERNKTQRASIKVSRNAQAAISPASVTSAISNIGESAPRTRANRAFGLACSLTASAQLAALYFGADSHLPLTAGLAAFIAQALVMCAIGWHALNRA